MQADEHKQTNALQTRKKRQFILQEHVVIVFLQFKNLMFKLSQHRCLFAPDRPALICRLMIMSLSACDEHKYCTADRC